MTYAIYMLFILTHATAKNGFQLTRLIAIPYKLKHKLLTANSVVHARNCLD